MTSRQPGRIGVIMGGLSSEREISRKSGRAVVEGLIAAGCDAVAVDLNDHDPQKIRRALTDTGAELAFVAMHGAFGEDGGLQNVLEDIGMPYTGSGVCASQLAMNKALTQNLLKSNGISVSDFRVVVQSPDAETGELWPEGWPVVVKPATEGSSIGVRIVGGPDQLQAAVKDAFRYGPTVLLEQFITGRELTVGILGGDVLPLIEIQPQHGYFDFTAKYEKGRTSYVVPAELAEPAADMVRQQARKTFELIGCRDFARVDVMIDGQGRPFILEVNTVPGFTATSLLPMAAAAAGIEFPQLCRQIAGMALERSRQDRTVGL